MFVGHYSAAFFAKSAQPKIPLWLLFVAAQFVDIFWSLFIMIGIEKVRIVPSLPSNPLDLYHMPYTHSLLAAFLWGCGAALLVRMLPFLRLSWGASILVGLTVFSHWLLDLFVHRPDLPLTSTCKVGLGLWNFPLWSFLLEVVLFSLSVAIFLRWGCPPSLKRKVLFLAGGMLLLQVFASFGPAPHQLHALVGSVLFFFLFLPWLAQRVERSPNPTSF